MTTTRRRIGSTLPPSLPNVDGTAGQKGRRGSDRPGTPSDDVDAAADADPPPLPGALDVDLQLARAADLFALADQHRPRHPGEAVLGEVRTERSGGRARGRVLHNRRRRAEEARRHGALADREQIQLLAARGLTHASHERLVVRRTPKRLE